LLWLISAGLSQPFLPSAIVQAQVSDSPRAASSALAVSWVEALKDTARSGRPSVVLVTSGALTSSAEWARQMHSFVSEHYGQSLNCVELRAESEPQRVRSLNVKSLPTVLYYRSDGKGGLALAGHREGHVGTDAIAELVGRPAVSTDSAADRPAVTSARRVVRVQRASVSTGGETPAGTVGAAESAAIPSRDAQVAATNHQHGHATPQGSPQNFGNEPPSKQMPPAPVKSPPTQPPQTYQAPPPTHQPVYTAQPPQPVYGYVPQQPVYAAPPTSPPLMVQPPTGQVVVQPAPLSVTVAPSPPPQVTYMTHMPVASMPQPVQTMPAPNAFTAPPPQPAMSMAPPAQPEPGYGMAPPNYGMSQPGFSAAPAGGSMAMGMMLTNPSVLDRMLGGFGRLLAERSYPRIRMNPESPSLFAAPAGMGGFVGINPAMAMAPSGANPLQTYMAMPNNGGGDATEAYLKAYIALCREKGITPNLPGWEPPTQPPTGPVPSPQDVSTKKKGWFFR
jgi:hypothetical protein